MLGLGVQGLVSSAQLSLLRSLKHLVLMKIPEEPWHGSFLLSRGPRKFAATDEISPESERVISRQRKPTSNFRIKFVHTSVERDAAHQLVPLSQPQENIREKARHAMARMALPSGFS